MLIDALKLSCSMRKTENFLFFAIHRILLISNNIFISHPSCNSCHRLEDRVKVRCMLMSSYQTMYSYQTMSSMSLNKSACSFMRNTDPLQTYSSVPTLSQQMVFMARVVPTNSQNVPTNQTISAIVPTNVSFKSVMCCP